MLAAIIVACSLTTWDPNAILENRPVCSRNGRFCAIVRWYDGVPDFGSRLAGELPDFDENAPAKTTITTALYEGRSLIAEVPLDIDAAAKVLVSDSGYVAGVADSLIEIYRPNGTRVRSITLADLGADEYDANELRLIGSFEFNLRSESDTREVIVVSVNGQERRIDLATGELLDPKHEFYRHPHVFVTAAPDQDSKELLSRVLLGPLPEYPVVARKARVQGTVHVRFVVSETGNVTSLEVLMPLPFGMDAATIEAAKQWIFLPRMRDGHRVQSTGLLLFHFENVWEDVWQKALQYPPPG